MVDTSDDNGPLLDFSHIYELKKKRVMLSPSTGLETTYFHVQFEALVRLTLCGPERARATRAGTLAGSLHLVSPRLSWRNMKRMNKKNLFFLVGEKKKQIKGPCFERSFSVSLEDNNLRYGNPARTDAQ